MRVGLALVTIAALVLGCAPSREAMSAGQVGCQESDIEISDDSSGLASDTWVATCDGVRFVCSQVVTGGGNKSVVTQVNCTPERKFDAQATAAPVRQAPAETEAPSAAPPTGAGGFLFGQKHEELERICRDGNFEFTDVDATHARCSGLPVDLGFAVSAELTLCREGLCRIALVADRALTGAARIKSFIGLAQALAKKYGQPYERTSTLPQDCTGDAVEGCLDSGRIDLKQLWRWPDRSINLVLDKPANAEKSELRLVYSRPSPTLPKADAL